MTDEASNVITVNGKDHNVEDLTNEQKLLLSHVQDLDRKVAQAQFDMDQLAMGREAVVQRLVNDGSVSGGRFHVLYCGYGRPRGWYGRFCLGSRYRPSCKCHGRWGYGRCGLRQHCGRGASSGYGA